MLRTEDFAEESIMITGTSLSLALTASVRAVVFPTTLIGYTKPMKITLYNHGGLKTSFTVDCGDDQFYVEPEEGVIPGESSVELVVFFTPRYTKEVETEITIKNNSNMEFLKPLSIPVRGGGGYPETHIAESEIDFGSAILYRQNRRVIHVENGGLAEALLKMTSQDAAISLEAVDTDEHIVPARTTASYNLVFTPTTLNALDSRVWIQSTDIRAVPHCIHVKAVVGTSKLQIDEWSSEIPFSVCKLGQALTKTYILRNTGTIKLSLQLDLTRTDEKRSPSICPFTTECEKTDLQAGDAVPLVIHFAPLQTEDYSYKLTLNYEHDRVMTTLSGSGGQSVITLDSPVRTLDFGPCRLNAVLSKPLTFRNEGNFVALYCILPDPGTSNWHIYEEGLKDFFELPLSSSVLYIDPPRKLQALLPNSEMSIPNWSGVCHARQTTRIQILMSLKSLQPITTKFRLYLERSFEEFHVTATGGMDRLSMYQEDRLITPTDAESTPTHDIGVHNLDVSKSVSFKLINEGSFPVDFIVQPSWIPEFRILTKSGHIPVGGNYALKVLFEPKLPEVYNCVLKVMWQGTPLDVAIRGAGGYGRLDIEWCEQLETETRGLDFAMVPIGSSAEKRFWVHNIGEVATSVDLSLESENFSLSCIQSAQLISRPPAVGTSRAPTKLPATVWESTIQQTLPPCCAIEVGLKFDAHSSTQCTGNVAITNPFAKLTIPLKGRGGTIGLAHEGDLTFGDISAFFVYTRKIRLYNTGTIPALTSLEWSVVSSVLEGQGTSHVRLGQRYHVTDPRSGSVRVTVQEHCDTTGVQLSKAYFFWAMIRYMTCGTVQARALLFDENGNLTSNGQKVPQHSMNAAMKALKASFHNIVQNTNLRDQSNPTSEAMIHVTPSRILVAAHSQAEITVQICLYTEETFLATLLCKPAVPNATIYSIPLSATPKITNIVCDDTKALDYGKQAIGEVEFSTRKFTNVGHTHVVWEIEHTNASLQADPSQGELAINESVNIRFAFNPSDEIEQNSPVYFKALNSQPIRFAFRGTGGMPHISISKYKKFDFGHCMIGKDTQSNIPISNLGSAVLRLTKFEINEGDTFFKGANWPKERVVLAPGATFLLQVIFNPHEESPLPSRITVGTISDSWHVELVGAGREAVLIVSRSSLNFNEALIGNEYSQKVGLKNVGDVNYPVKFEMSTKTHEIHFDPPSLILQPFSEEFVKVIFRPRAELEMQNNMIISSPYSQHTIPVHLQSGTAILEISHTHRDFGLFEKRSSPSLTFIIRNVGTMRTNYNVASRAKPQLFRFTHAKGSLMPKKSVEVTVHYVRHEIGAFEEKVPIKSDVLRSKYNIVISGRAEEAIAHPSDFETLSFGTCPVFELSTTTFNLRNYGMFPMEFELHFTYPIRVTPALGQIGGGQNVVCTVTWSPSGAYELRSSIKIITNIGTFEAIVRGKAVFPEIAIANQNLDFGICAIGHSYQETFTLINKGRIPVKWMIPSSREGFRLAHTSGILSPKGTFDVIVYFEPKASVRYTTSFVIECKGKIPKDVIAVGYGGQMKLDVSPQTLEVGKQYGNHIPVTVRLTNYRYCAKLILVYLCDQAEEQW